MGSPLNAVYKEGAICFLLTLPFNYDCVYYSIIAQLYQRELGIKSSITVGTKTVSMS